MTIHKKYKTKKHGKVFTRSRVDSKVVRTKEAEFELKHLTSMAQDHMRQELLNDEH